MGLLLLHVMEASISMSYVYFVLCAVNEVVMLEAMVNFQVREMNIFELGIMVHLNKHES